MAIGLAARAVIFALAYEKITKTWLLCLLKRSLANLLINNYSIFNVSSDGPRSDARWLLGAESARQRVVPVRLLNQCKCSTSPTRSSVGDALLQLFGPALLNGCCDGEASPLYRASGQPPSRRRPLRHDPTAVQGIGTYHHGIHLKRRHVAKQCKIPLSVRLPRH